MKQFQIIFIKNAHNIMLKGNDQVIKLNVYYEHSSVRRSLHRKNIERIQAKMLTWKASYGNTMYG